MAETEVVRIPKSWKGPIMALRDAMPEDAGAIALMSLVEVAGQTTPEPPQAPPEPPPKLLGRAVPYGIVGVLGTILDMAVTEPARTRELLIRVTRSP
ncbi:MAG: hypothetical protein LVS60_05555 [Nodosilinea sp. LVE1205-7]|jgi:hypothetical protein